MGFLPAEWKTWEFVLLHKSGDQKVCSNYMTIALISHIHRRTGRGGRGGNCPPIFRAVWDFIRAFWPKSTYICPNSLLIFKNSQNSGGRAHQNPHSIPFYEFSIRIQRVCLHARILRASKIGRFGQIEVRFGLFGWFATPLKISSYAYDKAS